MHLSQRLLCIANKVNKGSSIIDIGTDHAYVPIYLYINNIIKKAIAADISKGSCDKAIKNISKYNLSNYIKVIQSDGLKAIDTKEYNTLITAGMGGELITKILKESIKKLNSLDFIILQPQTEVHIVRKELHKLGYMIQDEQMIFEDRKYYNIIIAEKGKEVYNKEEEYLFGKILIDRKDSIFNDFLNLEMAKLNELLLILKNKNSDSINGRILKLERYICIIKKLLENM